MNMKYNPHHDDEAFKQWYDEVNKVEEERKQIANKILPALIGRPNRTSVITQVEIQRIKNIKDIREIEYL
jgi:hypothetical protein